jgi:hypothetical protein
MGIRKALLARFYGQRPQVPVRKSPKSGLADADYSYGFHIHLG